MSDAYNKWTLQQDVYLWKHRYSTVSTLAAYFERTKGAIGSRLKHLQDPSHAANVRLSMALQTGNSEMPLTLQAIRTKHANAYKLWTLEEDTYLWQHRDSAVSTLAAYFERSSGAINCRLEHLRDPSHVAHFRLSKALSMPIGATHLVCTCTAKKTDQTKWTAKQEKCLWQNRDCEYSILAIHFARNHDAIRNAMELLSELENDNNVRKGKGTIVPIAEAAQANHQQSNISNSYGAQRGISYIVQRSRYQPY